MTDDICPACAAALAAAERRGAEMMRLAAARVVDRLDGPSDVMRDICALDVDAVLTEEP